MLKIEKHKKSKLWLCCVECELDIRSRPLGIRRLRSANGKGKVVLGLDLGPNCVFGPKSI